jgi:hypothetical protein
MVEFSINPGNKDKAVQAFEQRGPNRNPGVTFRGAWIGKSSDAIFVLVESAGESLVTSAAKSWTEFDGFRITQVIDVEQF